MQEIENLQQLGYSILENIYIEEETNQILQFISDKELDKQFGVRYFLMNNEELAPLIFTSKLKSLIQKISPNAFVVKSIYFDKPPNANWIVNWHQDITINVTGESDNPEYTKWRKTKKRTAVRSPSDILEKMFTIRIHLDDCSEKNGALRIIPKSHLQGVIQMKNITTAIKATEKICKVKKGGILLMKPMVLHSSKRVENEMNRRIIHIEFSSNELAEGVNWLERFEIAK